MPRKHPKIEYELIREYIIPALEKSAARTRNPVFAFDGMARPGRAKAMELAAEWLEELLVVVAELKHGRRSQENSDDDWLASMEREMEAAQYKAQGLPDPSYRCPECGLEIEAGSKVAAGVRGLIHAECPN